MSRHDVDVALGAGIREARRNRMTQKQLAGALVAQGFSVDQPTVSKWESGERRPSLEEIAAIDKATGRDRGFVLVRAGLVEVGSVEAAVAGDSGLSQARREDVLRTYEAQRQLSALERV